jgi:hypothetical protein
MRERSENIHGKINEKLVGTFKGIEEERFIKVDANTGSILLRSSERNVQVFQYLEIPITIYTPAEVNKEKMVVFFHGGGKTDISL